MTDTQDEKNARIVNRYIELKCRENDKTWGEKIAKERVLWFSGYIVLALIILYLSI